MEFFLLDNEGTEMRTTFDHRKPESQCISTSLLGVMKAYKDEAVFVIA